MTEPALPPIVRSVLVSWDQEAAFRRFTGEFASWWPWRTHSIGGARVKRVVFETRVGGRIFEEHVDGRRFQWGAVLEWDPPGRVRFTFHPSREPESAQDVEVRFIPESDRTRVWFEQTGWGRGGEWDESYRYFTSAWKFVLTMLHYRYTVGPVDWSRFPGKDVLAEHERGVTVW